MFGAVQEEGDYQGARFASGQYHPAYAVIGEPTFWDRITVGYKGFARAKLTVRRPPAPRHPPNRPPARKRLPFGRA